MYPGSAAGSVVVGIRDDSSGGAKPRYGQTRSIRGNTNRLEACSDGLPLQALARGT